MDKKTVVVTGAGAGIGRSIALEFGARGYLVYVNGRSMEKVKETLELGKRAGYEMFPLIFDVSIEAQVKTEIEKVGHIDCLVNNAGVGVTPIFDNLTEADWNLVLNTNVKGCFFCVKYALRQMTRGGSIVNLSSGAAKTGGDFVSLPYSASKGAINSMTVSFARMTAPEGIRVNAVSPGFVDTDMLMLNESITREYYGKVIPIGRLGEPSDIAKAVAFLASDEADFITGQILEVNGGDIMG